MSGSTSVAVSVVIPFRDVTDYLPAALDGLARQTFGDFEVILVDDGSTRSYPDFVAAWSDRLAIRLFRLPPGGVSRARNAGVREARADWIAFLDADDVWLPEKLAVQRERVAAHPGAIASYGNMRFVDAAGNSLGKDLCMHHGVTGLPSEGLARALTRWSLVNPSTLLVRRADYLAIGGFDESLSYAEDWDLSLKLAQRGPVVAVQEPLVLYRRHGACATLSAKNHAQRQQVTERALALLPDADRPAARRYLAAQGLAEDAFFAVSQRRFGRVIGALAQALATAPAGLFDVVRARIACFAGRLAERRNGQPKSG